MTMHPTFLYHESHPKGKVFKDRKERDNAISDGWVEAPWLVGIEPEKKKTTVQEVFKEEIDRDKYPKKRKPGRPKGS